MVPKFHDNPRHSSYEFNTEIDYQREIRSDVNKSLIMGKVLTYPGASHNFSVDATILSYEWILFSGRTLGSMNMIRRSRPHTASLKTCCMLCCEVDGPVAVE